ncbi:MAG: caspase family protein [Acidobacteria bacterium]|nr:caspase family protein [Acidobacteriota bacterium]
MTSLGAPSTCRAAALAAANPPWAPARRLKPALYWCLLLVLVSSPAASAERFAVIVSGASGGEQHAEQQQRWRDELLAALTARFAFADANLVILDEESDGSSRATAENVQRIVGDLRRRLTRDDMLIVVLLGHGTFDGMDAKFNLVGPDLSAGEWKTLLDGLPGRLVVVNTTETSYPFLEELSARGRVIITATDSVAQRFATVFPEHFVRALTDPATDADKNGQVSVWEAFVAASAGVRRHYEERGQLSTERALLDDDGDGKGREADAPGEDGSFARAVHFDAPSDARSADPAIAALERQRLAVEQQIDDLKIRRPSMSEAEYQAELERLLVQLAKIAQQIRQGS